MISGQSASKLVGGTQGSPGLGEDHRQLMAPGKEESVSFRGLALWYVIHAPVDGHIPFHIQAIIIGLTDSFLKDMKVGGSHGRSQEELEWKRECL